jgi:hypothetical protein
VIEAPAAFAKSRAHAALASDPPQGGRIGSPRILLVATLRWPLAARLAIAFRHLGCPVEAWCPRGHPLEKTRAVGRIHRHSVLAPRRSLGAAIRASVPDLVVPCDDDAAIHLHHLHQSGGATGFSATQRLIERSLGSPASCSLAVARGELMRLALAEGVRIPATWSLACAADLDAACAQSGFPAVLKVDHSWGGFGVTVVGDIGQAHAAFRRAMHPSVMQALSHLVLRRDPSYLLRWFTDARPGVMLQSFIKGRPANRAVACWQGEVLAGNSVVALQTRSPTGPATVVRIVDNAEMTAAAERLVRALGFSGFCGLDFVIEAVTGAAWLIEINPRATPICHLPLGSGHDLPAALHARLRGEPMSGASATAGAALGGDVIAMFPGEWSRNPVSPYLRSAFHDVPWSEAELVRDCVALPWEERGFVARLRARLAPRRQAGAAGPPPCEIRPARNPPPQP